jgi:hypothetical protein
MVKKENEIKKYYEDDINTIYTDILDNPILECPEEILKQLTEKFDEAFSDVIAEEEIYDNILNDHPEIFMETYEDIMPDELNTDYEENFQDYIPEEYLKRIIFTIYSMRQLLRI